MVQIHIKRMIFLAITVSKEKNFGQKIAISFIQFFASLIRGLP